MEPMHRAFRILLERATGLLGRALRHPRLFLAALCLLLWAPGAFSLPPLDRDESRFAQASKQMLEQNDFVDIRFGTVPRYKKPVGIYWMQAATTAVADIGRSVHDRIWTYRLPSLIGAVLAVWLTYWCALGFAPPTAAFFAALLMGMTLLLTGESTIATTDAMLAACIVGGQGVFLRVYKADREGTAPPGVWLCLAGWAALGVGTLIKGPMALAIGALTALTLALWDGRFRRLDCSWLKTSHWHRGVLVILIIVAPWATAIALKSHGAFYDQALGHDFAAKIAGGQESHGAAPGYYLALLPLTFWPASLFLLQGIGEAVRRHREPAIRFLIAWIVPSWILFEAVPTKLPHYILPLYPALAMLAAAWISSPREEANLPCKVAAQVSPVLYVVGAIAMIAAAYVLPGIYGSGTQNWVLVVIVAFALLTAMAVLAYSRKAVLTSALTVYLSLLIFYPALTAGIGPGLERLWVSPRAAAAAHALAKPGDPPVTLAGYIEPSLMFLLGTDTRLTSGTGAAELGAARGGLALVERRHQADFLAKLADLAADTEKVGEVDGFNYTKGREVEIGIYRVTPVGRLKMLPGQK